MAQRSGSNAGRREAARERAAQQRAAALRAERRRRFWLIGGPVAAVAVAVALIVAFSAGRSTPVAGQDRQPVPAAVLGAVTSVPASTLNQVGPGTVKALPQAIKAPPLSSQGLPEVLYVGAEYCPYCAAERWAVVQALSRFGTFTGLASTHSSARDVFPNTPTFSFHGSSYRSQYLAFVGKELESNAVRGSSYAPLDTLSRAEDQVFGSYSQQRAFPFIDLGGKYVVSGLQYDNKVLQGLTMQQIAQSLAVPSSPVAQAVDGTANTLTAAICQLTGGRPGGVCTSPAVVAAQRTLHG